MKNPRVWLAVVTAAGVLYAVVGLSNRSSPGPLAAVHAREGKLAGFNSCAQCHGGWFGSMTDACLSCHEPIGRQIEKGHGLHGALDRAQAEACAACHSDHHGADFQLVNKKSFALAGVPDPDAFDHALVGYEMAGRHLELACTECHEHADADVLPAGATRFLGLDRDCATCHEDPHEPSYALSCAECHGQTSFKQLAPVDHDRHLPLIGGHADLSCTTCHAPDTPHALARLGRGLHERRTCTSCHESPHAEPFAAPGCATCHAAGHDSFRDERLTVTPAQHAASGFPLTAPHDTQSCEQCHAPTLPAFPERYPGRAADDCASCHLDPHGGQFQSTGCIDCHERTRFEPHAFTVAKHAQTKLPLDGAHLQAECSACHQGEPRAFRNTADDCAACHEDAHHGFFDQHAKRFRKTKHGQCAHCHGTTTFAKLHRKRFEHGEWTGFPIRGAHAQATCEACHPRAEEPDARGRRFGRVRDYSDCASCHEDPHGGAFDRGDLPLRVGGRASCARCHSETSFRLLRDSFDHGRWTGFPLDGAHGAAKCADCHVPQRRPNPRGRTWSRAKGSACADCHEDPHAGQFARGGVVSCERCHESATSFKRLVFRHNFDSRFRIDKAHANLDCAACHKPFRIGTQQIIRYRPMGRECADCHSPQRDPLRRRGKRIR